MKKLLSGVIIFSVGLTIGLVLTSGSLRAQGSASESDIMTKLNDIARAQKEIASTLASMKSDIELIKVRVTQLQ